MLKYQLGRVKDLLEYIYYFYNIKKMLNELSE